MTLQRANGTDRGPSSLCETLVLKLPRHDFPQPVFCLQGPLCSREDLYTNQWDLSDPRLARVLVSAYQDRSGCKSSTIRRPMSRHVSAARESRGRVVSKRRRALPDKSAARWVRPGHS